MMIADKYGNYINIAQCASIYVALNPDGGYQVQANTSDNEMFAQFAVNVPMTEQEANDLCDKIANTIGVIRLDD